MNTKRNRSVCAVMIVSAVPNEKLANSIAQSLLRKRLVACANIIGPMKSIYRYKGRVDNAKEFLLICKTTVTKSLVAERMIAKLHTYACPLIETIDIASMNTAAIEWLKECVGEP